MVPAEGWIVSYPTVAIVELLYPQKRLVISQPVTWNCLNKTTVLRKAQEKNQQKVTFSPFCQPFIAKMG